MLILYIKHVIYLKDYRIRSFLSIWHAHGDLCKHLGIDDHPDWYSNLFLNGKHLGIDSSTDHPDRYSNLFLNAYINRCAHTKYLNIIEVYSPLGIWHVFLYSINTNTYHFQSMKYRQYALIPANRRIHLPVWSQEKMSDILIRCARQFSSSSQIYKLYQSRRNRNILNIASFLLVTRDTMTPYHYSMIIQLLVTYSDNYQELCQNNKRNLR